MRPHRLQGMVEGPARSAWMGTADVGSIAHVPDQIENDVMLLGFASSAGARAATAERGLKLEQECRQIQETFAELLAELWNASRQSGILPQIRSRSDQRRLLRRHRVCQ